MPVLDEHLPHRIAGVDELAVGLHEDGLPLRGVVRLGVFAHEFFAAAGEMVEAADLGRAARHPDIARAQLARKARHARIVDDAVLPVDERHRTDLADELGIKSHIVSFFAPAWGAPRAPCGRVFLSLILT